MTASEAGCLVLDGAYLYDCGLAIKEDSLLLDPTISVPPAELGAWGWYSRVEAAGDNLYRIQRPVVATEVLPCAVALVRRGYNIHGHWLLEVMPRVLAALRLLKKDAIFVVGSMTPKYHIEMLEMLGVASDKIRYLAEDEAIFCDELWLPSVAHANQTWIHPYANETYDRLIEQVGGNPSRDAVESGRIFVTRGSRSNDPRPLVNVSQIEDIAKSHGYLIVDPGAVRWQDQIRLFASASKVVGLCGSGLHNTVFTKRNAHVCVLQPNQNFNYLQTSIAAIRGHAISYLMGDCYSGFDRSTWDASYAIDPKLFNLMLKTLL